MVHGNIKNNLFNCHLVSHCEVDPKVIVAEATWERVIVRVLKVEVDYCVPPSMV